MGSFMSGLYSAFCLFFAGSLQGTGSFILRSIMKTVCLRLYLFLFSSTQIKTPRP